MIRARVNPGVLFRGCAARKSYANTTFVLRQPRCLFGGQRVRSIPATAAGKNALHTEQTLNAYTGAYRVSVLAARRRSRLNAQAALVYAFVALPPNDTGNLA